MTMFGRLMAWSILTGQIFMPCAELSAQTTVPTGGNPIVFSAVARDANGFVRHSTALELDVRLVDRQSQMVLYSEKHNLSTDAMGQVQIPLGQGVRKSGDFRAVDFSQELDLVVYDGDEFLTRAPLSQVPSAAYAEKAEAAVTATNALSAETAKNAQHAATADNALVAQHAEMARTAENADHAQSAKSAEIAQTARVAESVAGVSFNDEGEASSGTIWSSEKVSRMIGSQTSQVGQTGLAKETAERKAEDLKLLDSLVKERNARVEADHLLKAEIDGLNTELDTETAERKASDDELQAGLDELGNALDKETADRTAADALLKSDLEDLSTNLDKLEANLADTAKVLWDTISGLQAVIKTAKADLSGRLDSINHCMVNNAEKGIYTAAIPLFNAEKPLEVGLFTEPLLKVLRQSSNGALFTNLDQARELKKSYRCRVMTYNESGDVNTPAEVYIPASTDKLNIYVDNVRVEEDVTYYTYDALVFDVEYYYLGDGITPKMYVTLIRE